MRQCNCSKIPKEWASEWSGSTCNPKKMFAQNPLMSNLPHAHVNSMRGTQVGRQFITFILCFWKRNEIFVFVDRYHARDYSQLHTHYSLGMHSHVISADMVLRLYCHTALDCIQLRTIILLACFWCRRKCSVSCMFWWSDDSQCIATIMYWRRSCLSSGQGCH